MEVLESDRSGGGSPRRARRAARGGWQAPRRRAGRRRRDGGRASRLASTATAVADRARPSSSASSPKKPPAPTVVRIAGSLPSSGSTRILTEPLAHDEQRVARVARRGRSPRRVGSDASAGRRRRGPCLDSSRPGEQAAGHAAPHGRADRAPDREPCRHRTPALPAALREWRSDVPTARLRPWSRRPVRPAAPTIPERYRLCGVVRHASRGRARRRPRSAASRRSSTPTSRARPRSASASIRRRCARS